jgi:archaeal flagellin FlaB
MYNMFLKDEKGFTGLEAAIVLIAFVVVAAVFSYVMLGAGFFTTQKSQEVVHTGVTQASSSIAPSGDVIVESTVADKAGNITIYVTNTAGGTPVDLNKTIITYTDNDDFVTAEYNGSANGWKYTPIVFESGHSDNLLESGEKYKLDLNLTTFGPASNSVATLPGVNEKIKVEIKPSEGAVLSIQKTMPPALAVNKFYPVY